MSAAREGAQLVNEGERLSEAFENGTVTAPVDRSTAPQGGAAAEQFPRRFGGRDPYDRVMEQRMALSDGDGRTPFGDLQYTDETARWLMRKQQTAAEAEFDAWFARAYHRNNLADRTLAQELNPEFYSAREREIMRRAQEAAKLKIIQLRGPRTKEELMKVWLIESGRVELPADWDRIGATYAFGERSQNEFKRGLFTLPMFVGAATRQERAERAHVPFRDAASVQNRFPLQGDATARGPLAAGANTYAQRFLSQVRQ